MKLETTLTIIGLAVGIGLVALLCSENTAAERGTKSSPKRPEPKHLNLAYGFSEGWLISHDFYVTNTCGEELSEVHLAFRFVGENASPSVDRYWAHWPLGATQHVSIPVEQVKNVQKIAIAGRADQGVFEASLVPAQ